MTNEELRKAAELAGLTVIERGYPFRHQFVASDGKGNSWESIDPALPAYVASLLVAKVKGLDGFDADLMPTSAGSVVWGSTLWAEGGRAIITRDQIRNLMGDSQRKDKRIAELEAALHGIEQMSPQTGQTLAGAKRVARETLESSE